MQKAEVLPILILENRQMIASILTDLLQGAGYQAEAVSTILEAIHALLSHPPAFFLADRGMVKPEEDEEWKRLMATIHELDLPALFFSCAPHPEIDPALVLRSPGDFAGVIAQVQEILRLRTPLLGITLVKMEKLRQEELDVVLRVQRELEGLGRRYPLGELLVRLDFVDPQTLEEALRKQET